MLSDALSAYQLCFGNREFSNLRSILKRRILPDLLKLDGLQPLQGKKLDYIFEHMPLAGFVARANPIFHSQRLQLARSNTLNVEKSQWKRFCTWLEAHEQYVLSRLRWCLLQRQSNLPTAISPEVLSKQCWR
jgi:hypothetical protein